MTAPDAAVVKRVRGIVMATVARHIGVPVAKLRVQTRLRVDPAALYRILLDIEGQLGIHPLDGKWSFDGDSIGAIVAYYAPNKALQQTGGSRCSLAAGERGRSSSRNTTGVDVNAHQQYRHNQR